jgi:hypothetical protein
MHWKSFFKPTISKVILFIILLTLVVVLAIFPGGEWQGYGFPLYYLEHYYGLTPTGDYSSWDWHYLNLVIDLIVWYVVSCGILTLFKRKG